MGESISSSSRTCCCTALFHCNKYHHQLRTTSAVAATVSDSEDVDSGWTAYFLHSSSQEEEAGVVAPREKLQDADVCGSACGLSLSSANKKTKAVKVKAGEMTKKKKKEEVEEDPLEDTASWPPLLLPNGPQVRR
ncbi:uncharacterized protein LOC133893367 isoform X2 [Phragmites australis]|uniref:uncharacterized protein LOC133893367 isoform X2 n=1 Tax=Phragmites australis TaxID=29695 RepID=UPI002D766E25|nr:uncharacterized protein LOC133893367 isoform X2 [Phragmites australis]